MVRLKAVALVVTLSLSGSLVAAADAATIGDLVIAAENASAAANLDSSEPAAAAVLKRGLQTLRDAGVLDVDISTFVRRYTSPDAVARAHRRQGRYSSALTDISEAIDAIKVVANSVLPPINGLTPELRSTVRELMTAEQKEGLTWDLETLRRLERKFGPDSAHLNGVEVLAAYTLQRLPWFGVNKGGRPGPLEAVLAYVPSYFTRADKKMRLVGVAELGLRHYIFKQGWGAGSGTSAWLRPGYLSYGVAWAGPSDDPLSPPWKGSSRVGAYFGWGKIKVAWLASDDHRLLVTQQIQLVPWVF